MTQPADAHLVAARSLTPRPGRAGRMAVVVAEAERRKVPVPDPGPRLRPAWREGGWSLVERGSTGR
jgi:hypothetical protein